MERFAIKVTGSVVTWIGTDWDCPMRSTREFSSNRGTRRAALIYANALCESGAACLLNA